MFSRIFPTQKRKWRLGLQFLPYAVRMVETRAGDLAEVRKAATIPLDPGMIDNYRITNLELLGFELEKKVKEWGCKGREVVLSVPLPIVVIRRMPIVKVAEKDIRPLVEIEMENTLHLPFQDPIFDYIVLSQSEADKATAEAAATSDSVAADKHDKLNLLIVAAPGDAVEKYVEVVRKAGLKPVAVDIEPLALYRQNEKEIPTIHGHGVLQLHVTLTGVDAAIFSQGIPEFVRYIPLPVPFFQSEQLNEALELCADGCKHLEQSGQFSGYANDMFAEVNRIMSFYQYSMHEGKQKIENVILSGEFGDIRKLANYLQERMSAKVSLPSNESITLTEPLILVQPYRVATGLGTKDVSGR